MKTTKPRSGVECLERVGAASGIALRNEGGHVHGERSGRTGNGFDWAQVDDVLLDMDGTLLDRHFDNYFFEEALPRRYADTFGKDFAESKQRLMEMYRAVEGRLEWADLDYWTRTLGIDVVGLSREWAHLIGYLPDAVEFLAHLRGMGKRVTLVTNAHPGGIEIKTGKTGLDGHVDRIVGAFDLGCLKMQPGFWSACRDAVVFDPVRTLYVDDDETCLVAAEQYGIRYLYHSAKSSSQLPTEPSARFPAISAFSDLTGE